MEGNIFESCYKRCKCCGQVKSLVNFRRLDIDEIERLNDALAWVAETCKICEGNEEHRDKSKRVEKIRSKMARYRENEQARLAAEKRQGYLKEIAELR